MVTDTRRVNVQQRLLKKESNVYAVVKFWRIINEYMEKDKTILHSVTDDWNKQTMLPLERLRELFYRVDAILSEFSIKCEIVMLDPQILSRVETLVPIHITKEFEL